MKKKYLSPTVISVDAIEGKVCAFPAAIIGVMEAAAVAATAAYGAGKVLKSVIKASPTSRLPSFADRWRNNDDFCLA